MFNKVLKISYGNLVTAFLYISMIFLQRKSFFLIVLLLNVTSTTFAQDESANSNIKKSVDDLFTNLIYTKKLKEVRGELISEDKKIETIRDFRNNLTILYFWATWCTDCLNEMKSLLALKNELTYREITNIKIIPLSIDFKQAKSLRAYLNNKGLQDLNFYKDSNKQMMHELSVDSIPQSFLINEDGFVIGNFKQIIDWSDKNVLDNLLKLRSENLALKASSSDNENSKTEHDMKSKHSFTDQKVTSLKAKNKTTFIG